MARMLNSAYELLYSSTPFLEPQRLDLVLKNSYNQIVASLGYIVLILADFLCLL
jgi:hypothetical protein